MAAIPHRDAPALPRLDAPFCVLASTFLDGSYRNRSTLRVVQCAKCSKQIWAPKQTSTRDCNPPACTACRAAPRRQAIVTSNVARMLASVTPSDARLLSDLGIDAETYQLLRRLELRDIGPNDYEVLLRLHAKPSVKTCEQPCSLTAPPRSHRHCRTFPLTRDLHTVVVMCAWQ